MTPSIEVHRSPTSYEYLLIIAPTLMEDNSIVVNVGDLLLPIVIGNRCSIGPVKLDDVLGDVQRMILHERSERDTQGNSPCMQANSLGRCLCRRSASGKWQKKASS